MRKEVLFISFIIIFIFISIYTFINKDFFSNNLVQVIERQDSLPGGHFVLKDQNNQIFDSAASQKLMLIYFGFTYCPDICPISANLIANAIDELKDEQFSTDDIKFFFVTVDPRRDTPRRLNEFLDSFNSEIIGLTGSQKELLPIWKDFFVHVEPSIDSQHQTNLNLADQDIDYEPEIENYMVQHTAFFYIFDKNNNIKSILPFGASIEQLKKELKIVGQ